MGRSGTKEREEKETRLIEAFVSRRLNKREYNSFEGVPSGGVRGEKEGEGETMRRGEKKKKEKEKKKKKENGNKNK